VPSNLSALELHLQALGPTIVAVVVGLVASYIAWRQWQTAKHRLRLDMFDRRLAVYNAVKNLIGIVQVHGGTLHDDLQRFYRDIRGAEFLFDGDTRDLIMKIGSMVFRARMARQSADRRGPSAAADGLIDEEEAILEFLQTLDQRLEQLFARYLDLSKIGL
jgi:hypothetical protein